MPEPNYQSMQQILSSGSSKTTKAIDSSKLPYDMSKLPDENGIMQMRAPSMKQGLGGVQYDPSKVFDPSAKAEPIAGGPAKTGLSVSQQDGTSTLAGAGYYAGRSIPSGPPQGIAGMKLAGGATQQAAQAEPIGGFALAGNASQPTTQNTTAQPIAGVKQFDFNKMTLAGGTVANNSNSDWSPGSRNVQAIAGTSGLNVGPTSFTHTTSAGPGQQTVEQIGTLSNRNLAGLNYDEQVAKAKEINADSARQLALTPSPKEASAMAILNNRGASLITKRNAAADLAGFEGRKAAFETKDANNQALQVTGMKLANDRYTADQSLAGEKYKADQHLAGVGLQSDAELAKSMVAGSEKAQQQYTDRVKGLVSDWSKLNVPTEVAPKMNYYAQLHAQAEDPKGKVFMLSPNRQGGMYAALPKQYEQHYQGLLQKGMGHNDAAARIYTVAKKNGHVIDVPDFNRFQTKRDAVNGG